MGDARPGGVEGNAGAGSKMSIVLLLAAFGVGTLIGAVGIGGLLLIPALTAFGHLGIHEAMATALFTFLFTGIAGTWHFQRRGSIDWRITVPVCVGALLFGFSGAWANARLDTTALQLILAGVIVFAGIYTVRPLGRDGRAAFAGRTGAQRVLLLGVGSIAGFGSGLTGVGGPALSVPLMVLFGFPALQTIGASQAIQIVAAASGTLGNLQYGSIDTTLALPVTAAELAGVWLGARIAHAVDAGNLRRFVAVLCIATGAALFVQALGLA